jgi:hypothetical protein
MTLGDFSDYFSEFSLNQKLRGVESKWLADKDLNATMVMGVGNRAWEELLGTTTNTTYRSTVLGVQGSKSLNRNAQIDFAYVNSADDATSASLNAAAKQNSVVAVSGTWKKAGWANLAVAAEVAANAMNTRTTSNISDNAYKLKLTWADPAYKTSLQVKRVGNLFYNVGIPVENDLQELRWDLSSDFWNKTVATRLSFRNFNDNLSGQKSTTVMTSVPQWKLLYKPAKDWEIGFVKEITSRSAGNKSIQDNTDVNSLKLKQTLDDLIVVLDYRVRNKIDQSVSTSNSNVAQTITSLTLQGESPLMPGVLVNSKYKYEHDAEQIKGAINVANQLDMGLIYKWTDSLSTTLRTQWWAKHRTQSDDTTKGVCELAFAQRWADQNALQVRYELRDYGFSDRSKNYREDVWSMEGSMAL